jgi:hypothetical protein
MTKPTEDLGMIQLFLMRLNEQRLPRAMKLLEQVEKGECLSHYDLQFMRTVLEDAGSMRQLAAKYPEYQVLVDKVAVLYAQISRKALENQEKVSGPLL